jgi:hypothetical protein
VGTPRKPPEPFRRFKTRADSSSSLDGSRFSWVEGAAEARDAPPPAPCEVDMRTSGGRCRLERHARLWHIDGKMEMMTEEMRREGQPGIGQRGVNVNVKMNVKRQALALPRNATMMMLSRDGRTCSRASSAEIFSVMSARLAGLRLLAATASVVVVWVLMVMAVADDARSTRPIKPLGIVSS